MRVRFLRFVFGLVLLGFAVACSSPPAVSPAAPAPATSIPAGATQENTTATPGAAASSSLTPPANPSDAVLIAETGLIGKSFRSTITTQDSTAPTPTIFTIEFTPQCNVHEVSSSGLELIIIQGQGTWIKQSGKWVKATDSSDLTTSICGSYSEQQIQQMRQDFKQTPPQFVGADVIDGQPMWVYTYATTIKGVASGGGDVTSQNRIWIGATDGLPHKLQSTSPSLVKQGATVQSVTMYQYDPTIHVQPPE